MGSSRIGAPGRLVKVVFLFITDASIASPPNLNQILMDEYGTMSKKDFTMKWSQNGRLLPATQIIKALRAKNTAQDKNYVQLAVKEYPGDLFAKIFSYQSHGKLLVMKDEHAIAKRYLNLKSKQGIV